MQCPSCGQQTEEGKFCTNCGAPLHANENAAANEPVQNQTQTTQAQQPQGEQATPQAPNEAVEKIKEIGNNFSNFFLTLVKKPTAAKQANQNDWISSVITMVIYTLVFALGYFFVLKSAGGSVMNKLGGLGDFLGDSSASTAVPFTDGFLWPFLKFAILIAIVVGVTFIVLKLATSDFNFLETVGKYGAYLMPFTLLLVLGYILMLIKLQSVGAIVLFLSFFAVAFIIPTILLMEEKSVGIDRIYLMVIAHVVNLGVFFYLIIPFILPVFVMTGIDSFMDDLGF